MTNYRWKAETELWMSDPEYWVWQVQDSMGVWITLSSQHPPYHNSSLSYRLVPRPWLEEPGKWEVERTDHSYSQAWHRDTNLNWNHGHYEYRLVESPRTAYQARVEIPAPETEAPPTDMTYYVSDPAEAQGYIAMLWRGNAIDLRMLERGLVYLTPENAAARSEAMRKFERCAG